MADSKDREAAIAATDEQCPRCGSVRERDQAYCLVCGLPLPQVEGAVAALRRSWIRRFGWYPGDWVWISAVSLLVAVAGAAVSIALTTHRHASAAKTVVESTTTRTTTTTAKTTTPATTTTVPTTTKAPTATTTPAPPNGQTVWPRDRTGWTVVLGSYPVTSGEDASHASAARAARSLPAVGVLDSSDYASLHPGYYVVFAGIYGSEAQAAHALPIAQASGFAGAYPREVSR